MLADWRKLFASLSTKIYLVSVNIFNPCDSIYHDILTVTFPFHDFSILYLLRVSRIQL